MTEQPSILVTGGTGMLGAHLLHQLVVMGKSVRAIRRPNSPRQLIADLDHTVQWVEADLLDIPALEDAMQGIKQIYHCGAMVSFHPRDVAQMRRINIEGTANLVNIALDQKVERLIHVSSIAALGRSKNRLELDEKSRWIVGDGNSNYGKSKYEAELEVRRGIAEGLPAAIVNPGVILGSGFWHQGSARFFTQIHNGLRFLPTGFSGFVDARDVARFMIKLMESPITDQRYILVGEHITYADLFQQIALHLQVPAPSIKVTPLLAEIAWRVEWLKEKLTGKTPMVTKETARGSLNSYTYDNRKSLALFPDFTYTSVADTLSNMAKDFKRAPMVDGRREALRMSMER